MIIIRTISIRIHWDLIFRSFRLLGPLQNVEKTRKKRENILLRVLDEITGANFEFILRIFFSFIRQYCRCCAFNGQKFKTKSHTLQTVVLDYNRVG